jgi:hypothetical protein
MTDIRLIGEDPVHKRQLYLARLPRLSDWPTRFEEPARPFVVFTAFDAKRLTDIELRTFARRLLDEGCVYACSWGEDAGRVETAFDLVATEADLSGQPYVDDVMMTTSHKGESLDDLSGLRCSRPIRPMSKCARCSRYRQARGPTKSNHCWLTASNGTPASFAKRRKPTYDHSRMAVASEAGDCLTERIFAPFDSPALFVVIATVRGRRAPASRVDAFGAAHASRQ